MDLNSAHSVAEAERIFGELEKSRADAELKIATNSRGHAGGGEAAVTQAVITWAQTQRTARLTTYAPDEADPQIETLTRHLVGLSAALLCDEATTLDGGSVRTHLKDSALKRLNLLQSIDPRSGSRGPQLEIICVDHINRPYPKTLYDVDDQGGGSLKPETAFRDVGRLMLKATMPEGAKETFDTGLTSAIGDALYELFRNTDDHARTDVRGDHLGRSIRGIQARRHALSPADLEKAVQHSPSLLNYCRRRRPREGRAHIQLIEFSVFDSGPGLASRRLGHSRASRAEELTAINACFALHGSSKPIHGRGMGLPIVIAALRERDGFFRVRTGHHSLYADLGGEREIAFGVPPTLRPWSGEGDLPQANGALVTFLLPLEDVG
jgi:hypothetical protein